MCNMRQHQPQHSKCTCQTLTQNRNKKKHQLQNSVHAFFEEAIKTAQTPPSTAIKTTYTES